MRRLRSYTRVAETTHDCDRCMQQIMPGDQYEGTVYAIWRAHKKKNIIMVLKEHLFPSCDFPPEPDDKLEVPIRRELLLAA